MYHKNFSEITDTDIDYLINNKIPEQKTLEYKRQLPDKNKEDEKIKILQCISSFANSEGGVIIFGIKENEGGAASEIINIETSTDDDFLRLLNMIRDKIEPRMTPPDLRELKVNEKKIYLMKILPSYAKPHFVKGNCVFYGRSSSGKYMLDVGDIRNIFLQSKNAEEQFDNFRTQRIMKLKSGNFPYKYYSQKIVTLHIASLSSINNSIQLSMAKHKDDFKTFFPLCTGRYSGSNNYDGCLNYFTRDNLMYSYLQIFRNGMIEASRFDFFSSKDENIINGTKVENQIMDAVKKYINELENLNIGLPFFISLSLLNIKGHKIIANGTDDSFNPHGSNGIFENDLLLPTIYIDSENELDEKLWDCFDVLWNVSGRSESPSRPQKKVV